MTDRKEIEDSLLQYVEQHGLIEDSLVYVTKHLQKPADEHDKYVAALRSLYGFQYLSLKEIDRIEFTLTAEGKEYEANGAPEAQLWNAIDPSGSDQKTLQEQLGKKYSVAFPNALRRKWVQLDKQTKQLQRTAASIVDEVGNALKNIVKGDAAGISAETVAELKKRQLVTTRSNPSYRVEKGPKFTTQRKTLATDLTVEMLQGDAWKEQEFKDYNFEAPLRLSTGCLHPLMKVRSQFRSILLEMGFTEMPTNNFVESSFWNFDALFQPQQHPARDSHDTFFLSSPANTTYVPEDYKQRVHEIHEKGGHGSIGWRYDWKWEEAQKNILRTHTTAVSARMLYLLAQQKPIKPIKYFSIDRVFRNETLDYTHLAEFHQVEGLVADYDLTLGDLIGVIKTFFSRIGINDVKFKPAYNPYTEPSMEIFGFSSELNKWIEIGNSGVFRPEMLQPMGLPENLKVIAWGLSLERPTMIKYGIGNIRSLFGPKVSLDLIQRNPIARFDLVATPEQILPCTKAKAEVPEEKKQQ